MKEKFYGFRQRLSRKRWFRLVADRLFPGEMYWVFDVFAWDIFYYMVRKPQPFTFFDQVLLGIGLISYVLLFLDCLTHLLDTQPTLEDENYRVWFWLTLAVPVLTGLYLLITR